ERIAPPSAFGARRSCVRVASTIGDGFCDAVGGVGLCAAADECAMIAKATITFGFTLCPSLVTRRCVPLQVASQDRTVAASLMGNEPSPSTSRIPSDPQHGRA